MSNNLLRLGEQCLVCGEGTLVPVVFIDPGEPLLFMHECNYCKSELAGEAESTLNLALAGKRKKQRNRNVSTSV